MVVGRDERCAALCGDVGGDLLALDTRFSAVEIDTVLLAPRRQQPVDVAACTVSSRTPVWLTIGRSSGSMPKKLLN